MQPIGGLFSMPVRLMPAAWEAQFEVQIVELGDTTTPADTSRKRSGRGLTGSGTGLAYADAIVPAVAEGLERYCTCVFSNDQFVVATARQLGDEALDLDTIPRCSDAELGDPKCPLIAPDKDAPMRWVRGISIPDGRLTYIPAVMVYLNAGVAHPGERIALPITTGCAAYTSYEGALLRGICEVLERDANGRDLSHRGMVDPSTGTTAKSTSVPSS